MIDNMYIIGSIAAKDIQDAIKNRFVIYQIIAVSVILLSIRGLGMILEPRWSSSIRAAPLSRVW